LSPGCGIGERKRGARSGSETLPPLPPSGGRMKRRLGCGPGKYPPPNSRSAARARAASPPSPTRSLSPPPFPFEHPTQSLTARWAAKLLARAATGAYQPFFAARTLAAQKIEFTCWALTLAGLRRTRAGGFQCRSQRWLDLGGLPMFRALTSIPPALRPSFVPSIGGLTILPAGAPSPPSPSRGTALGATVSGLGMGGVKELLTSLEQTTSLSRPMSPLTATGIAASWSWAQGSC
jgi:hypothetical protein